MKNGTASKEACPSLRPKGLPRINSFEETEKEGMQKYR